MGRGKEREKGRNWGRGKTERNIERKKNKFLFIGKSS